MIEFNKKFSLFILPNFPLFLFAIALCRKDQCGTDRMDKGTSRNNAGTNRTNVGTDRNG